LRRKTPRDKSQGYVTAPDKSGLCGAKPDLSGAVLLPADLSEGGRDALQTNVFIS
jgi:hypothetical protein